MRCDSCNVEKIITIDIVYKNLNREVVGLIDFEWCANEKCIVKLLEDLKRHITSFAQEIEKQRQQANINASVKGEFDPSDIT